MKHPIRARLLSLGLAAGFLTLLVGCRAPACADLSEPFAWQPLEGPPVPVAADGRVLPVVAADSPDCRWVAAFLANVIEESCGTRPDVLIEAKGQKAGLLSGLFIGDVSANAGWSCPLAAESADAFRVVARDGAVRFLGRSDYAVFDWCERELGYRFYCAVGRCAERRAALSARPVDYSDRPVFEHRMIGGRRPEPWVRACKVGSSHRGGVHVHAPHRWHRDPALLAAHPEIFETGETPMLCYGKFATLDYYKTRIDRHLAGLQDSGGIVDTNRKVVTVCQWDAPIRCACPLCARQYARDRGFPGEASPVIWGAFLANLSAWLKSAHPDYMISFLPYLNTCEVPAALLPDAADDADTSPFLSVRTSCGCVETAFENWAMGRRARLSGNAEAQLCSMPGLALFKNPACRENEERLFRDWARATGRKVLGWHYECWPREWTSAPYVFGRTIQRHYAAMQDLTCGSYICGDSHQPRTALSTYVWLRCLWNPHVDVEAIYDGFAQRMFGPAAPQMRELIRLQEDCWERPWPDNACSYRNIFETSFPPGDVARLVALIREAYAVAKAAGDEPAKRRVAWYAQGLEPFLSEADALARRTGPRSIRLGETNAFVVARDVAAPRPAYATTVVSESDADARALRLRVVCSEPAAARMDFAHRVPDFVWGDDSVSFVFERHGQLRTATVYATGEIEGDVDGFTARVSHDDSSWIVTARLPLTNEDRRNGFVRGNVSRWRVGDRRLSARAKGSRYEHTRLDTCYTQSNADPAAFVLFHLTSAYDAARKWQ